MDNKKCESICSRANLLFFAIISVEKRVVFLVKKSSSESKFICVIFT